MGRPAKILTRARGVGEMLPASSAELPEDLLWVYNHPFFSGRKTGQYPPAPNQGAENFFKMCKGDLKFRGEFFKKCQSELHRLHAVGQAKTESDAEKHELKSIDDMRVLIKQLLDDAGIK